MSEFLERTETRTNFPNFLRILSLLLHIFIIIHWNGCLYFAFCILIGPDEVQDDIPKWTFDFSDESKDSLRHKYIYSIYWSTLILTTIGQMPNPVRIIEYIFQTINFLIGILIFATIVGNISSMIQHMNVARSEMQIQMESVRQYIHNRKVSKDLELRVSKWFNYLWINRESLGEEKVLGALPEKLQIEIAIQVHLETLKKLAIFKDADPGFLIELVLRLKLQVFSPGDFICRKGDLGKEMFIVKRGQLSVVSDDGDEVFVTLKEGTVFGELSLLNIIGQRTGNRRTANVRSEGYSDLFCLSKKDLWEVLREYPETKETLIARAKQILLKDGLLDIMAAERHERAQKAAMHKVTCILNDINTLEDRMAHFIGDFKSSSFKLIKRIRKLEMKLGRRYRD